SDVVRQSFESSFLELVFPYPDNPLGLHTLAVKDGRQRLAYGLRPDPGLQSSYPSGMDSPDRIQAARQGASVGTRMPTLQWERFPREVDAGSKDAPLLKHITNVTYEVKYWLVTGDGRLIQEVSRQGLVDPQFRLVEPLGWQSTYAWTVRAHFEL